MSDILSDLRWRYAVKKFDEDKTIPIAKMERIKEAFNLTATSYGLQPIRLVVLRNKEIQKQLVAHSFEQAQVLQASHVLIICIENKVDEAYINSYFKLVKKIRGTSDEILNPFKEITDEVLGLQEKGLSSVLLLPIGYRADDDMFSNFKKVRKNLDDSVLEIF